ncbi:uncharacterized protein LOC135195889 [Macrobrachium nipponense]|uniref:uncharacterized protein LOC135195889 n=1 Tax=Macrobrachium nipponense TaxID=159736 RepID=UPI0030C7DFF6
MGAQEDLFRLCDARKGLRYNEGAPPPHPPLPPPPPPQSPDQRPLSYSRPPIHPPTHYACIHTHLIAIHPHSIRYNEGAPPPHPPLPPPPPPPPQSPDQRPLSYSRPPIHPPTHYACITHLIAIHPHSTMGWLNLSSSSSVPSSREELMSKIPKAGAFDQRMPHSQGNNTVIAEWRIFPGIKNQCVTLMAAVCVGGGGVRLLEVESPDNQNECQSRANDKTSVSADSISAVQSQENYCY